MERPGESEKELLKQRFWTGSSLYFTAATPNRFCQERTPTFPIDFHAHIIDKHAG